MLKEPEQASKKHSSGYQKVNPISIGVAVIIPSLVGFFFVLFLTSSIELIARQLWSLAIIWPDVLFIGGLSGGFLGGLFGIWEISMFHKQNRKISSGKILSPDLYYVFALIVFTYILEFISDSYIPQSILFFLEIGFFLIIGWNLSKIMLETETKDSNEQLSETDTNQMESPEIEKYMSE
jgi:hypothetical protein